MALKKNGINLNCKKLIVKLTKFEPIPYSTGDSVPERVFRIDPIFNDQPSTQIDTSNWHQSSPDGVLNVICCSLIHCKYFKLHNLELNIGNF
jgi:hypothetical protein